MIDGGEGGGWCQAATYSSNRYVHIFPFCLCVCVCACVYVSYLLSLRLAFLNSVYVPFSLYIVLSSVLFLLSSSIILPVRFLLSLFPPSRIYFLFFVSLFQYFLPLYSLFRLQFLRYIHYLRRPLVYWPVSVPEYMN